MYIYFNPLDIACKSVSGALREDEQVQFNLFLQKNKNDEIRQSFSLKTPKAEDCFEPKCDAILCLNKDGEACEYYPMKKTGFGWTITIAIHQIGLYFYHFEIEGQGNVTCTYLEMGEVSKNNDGFLLTVYSCDYKTPEWFKGGVMYQIFPDRFYKVGTTPDIAGRICRADWGGTPTFRPNEQGKVLNNDFFGGNFKGVQSKLDYLQELGVTTIYFNPVFQANSNHRYDTSDYTKIDPFLGDENNFEELVKAADDKGIKIILDGVFNHTGDDSVYFNKYGNFPSVGAYQSKDSPYYSWYNFQKFPDEYSSWWGIDILPDINENSESYQEFIFGKDGVLKKWLGFGIGGYRLDVADELPDFFLKKLRKSVKESNKDAIIIGEVWEDASNKIAYSARREYLQGYELDSVMNYPLKDAIIRYIQTGNALDLLHCIRVLIDHYPKDTLNCLMNILGTHDTARILTVLGGIYCKNKEEMASDQAYLSASDKKKAISKLKMAAVIQYTLPGVPCIYYGDENGMEGHIDPFCRRCFDWDNLNADLIGFYQNLGKIREKYREIFIDGDFREILARKDGLFYYKRIKDKKEIYVCVNNSSKKYSLKISERYIDCLNNNIFDDCIEIKPYSYNVFVKAINSKIK